MWQMHPLPAACYRFGRASRPDAARHLEGLFSEIPKGGGMAEAPLMLGLEVAFDLLTAAVGAVAVGLLLRADPLLSLSKRARTLRLAGVVVAVILVAPQAAEGRGAFSRG